MKIALATRSLGRGGAPVQVVNLAFGLARRGHDVSVIVVYANGDLQRVLEAKGISVYCLGKRGRWHVIAPWVRYVQLVRRLRFEVIYSYLPLENILSLAVSAVTGVTSVWGMRGASQNEKQHGYASKLLWGLQRRFMDRPAAVISNSRAAVAELSASRRQRVSVIPNGIDTERFRPDEQSRRLFRSEMGLNDSDVLIGCVARLDRVKDHPTFLRAAALIQAARKEARFAIIGSGPREYRESLQQLAAQLGIGEITHWLGERADIECAMNALDLYMSASAAEGVSNSLCEAMACGVLPVVTDVGDSRSVVDRFGAVVSVGHPELLANAAVLHLDVETAQLRSERRKWIVDNFGIDRMVDESLRVFAMAVRGARESGAHVSG